ncbi:unnamed protein product [Nippostrongylus brasiliensis]|uniref:MSP domain-containing protein n=1 Tax=Nippostrongylus brasiliensis TaxID=27835 RepID=A0A0N4XTM8_NIPBR|nr:unnamed protein product [Nippostrongylus brasiliensis]
MSTSKPEAQPRLVVSVERSDTSLPKVKFSNTSDQHLVWRLAPSHDHDHQMALEPRVGVVPPREVAEMKVKAEAKESGSKLTTERRVGIEWIRAPAEAKDGEVSEEWFNSSDVVHRKYFNIVHE